MPDTFLSEQRKNKIRSVLAHRQKGLELVLNNIHDPHNVSAILRSCDAFGVNSVHLFYDREAFPPLAKSSSSSAKKWVDRVRHTDPKAMIDSLHARGYQCIATGFSETARPLPDWDLTRPTAIVMGNEHRGVDENVARLVDGELYIPMFGMVQSLNVSVAAATILYEAMRQRLGRGMYDKPTFDDHELDAMYNDWCGRGRRF
jgi:tRNA (guanosine-2'-O-)-methyltransferase